MMGTIKMRIKLQQIVAQFDELALRLRLMLTLCLVVVLFMLFDIFWFSSSQQQINQTKLQITNNQKQINELIDLQNQQNNDLLKIRNNPKQKQLKIIEGQLDDIRKKLTKHTLNLVQPEEMADVLKTIILSSQSLKLQQLVKHQTQALSINNKPNQNDGDSSKNQEKNTIQLYRHSMEIVLHGDYKSTYRFLEKLEQMKKKVAFDRLEYVVEHYPKAQIKLTVSTLSLRKEWIGG